MEMNWTMVLNGNAWVESFAQMIEFNIKVLHITRPGNVDPHSMLKIGLLCVKFFLRLLFVEGNSWRPRFSQVPTDEAIKAPDTKQSKAKVKTEFLILCNLFNEQLIVNEPKIVKNT